MQLTPAQSLLLLVLTGLAISGWLYGLHWKRIASGDTFTKEEKVMIRLQDQIAVLTEKNAELNQALHEATSEERKEYEESGKASPQVEYSTDADKSSTPGASTPEAHPGKNGGKEAEEKEGGVAVPDQ